MYQLRVQVRERIVPSVEYPSNFFSLRIYKRFRRLKSARACETEEKRAPRRPSEPRESEKRAPTSSYGLEISTLFFSHSHRCVWILFKPSLHRNSFAYSSIHPHLLLRSLGIHERSCKVFLFYFRVIVVRNLQQIFREIYAWKNELQVDDHYSKLIVPLWVSPLKGSVPVTTFRIAGVSVIDLTNRFLAAPARFPKFWVTSATHTRVM